MRRALTVGVTGLVALAVVLAATAGRFRPGDPSPPTPTHIPALDDSGAACINRYPERLAEYPIAFSGTPLTLARHLSCKRLLAQASRRGVLPLGVEQRI